MERVKRVGEAVLSRAALNVIRQHMRERIRKLDPWRLKEAVDKWEIPDPLELAGQEDREYVERYAKFATREMLDKFNARNMLEWGMVDWPLQAGVLIGHPRGVEYLEEFIRKIKLRVWPHLYVKLVPVTTSEHSSKRKR